MPRRPRRNHTSCSAQHLEGAVAVHSRLASLFWNVRFGAVLRSTVDHEALSSRASLIAGHIA